MVDTLIFDFGDVFINLDKSGAMANALNLFQMETFEEDMIATNIQYEVGEISTEDFIAFYTNKFKHLTEEAIINAWNFIIKDFPKYRLDFIQSIRNKEIYKCILLSNTNSLHIDFIKTNVSFYDAFKNCFDAFYLSHEIHLRKPNEDIFKFVIDTHQLKPEECLFIDDTSENTETAKALGLHVWNIDETKEDVIHLFETQSHLF